MDKANVRNRIEPNKRIEPEATLTKAFRNEEDEIGEQANEENRLNEIDEIADNKQQEVAFSMFNGIVERIVVHIAETICAKIYETGAGIGNKLQNWRATKKQISNEGKRLWRKHAKIIKMMIVLCILLGLAAIILRILYMVFGVQDEMQSFAEFVQEKDQKYAELINAHNNDMGDLYTTQDQMKEQLKIVEKVSRESLANHTGELQEMKGTIVEVKSGFEKFMVESQAHMLELQQENQVMQQNMMDMQKNMNQDMGKVREDVDTVRSQYDRLKMSLDSIDYNIRNLKNCGFFSRLFGLC